MRLHHHFNGYTITYKALKPFIIFTEILMINISSLPDNAIDMKILFYLIFSLIIGNVSAQTAKDSVKTIIQTFFEGMKKNDTALIATSLDTACTLNSVMEGKNGNAVYSQEKISSFLEQVAQLKGSKLDERLLSYDIKVDGALAIAWTPYEFYFNDQFSHCGVNIFTLIKRNDRWVIKDITDTRRKYNCR
jgi:hypothetical protein